MELTDAGRAIFHNILSILENVEQLHRNIEVIGAGGRSHVRIWVSPAAISERIPEELSSFIQTHKDMTVELEERDSSEIIKAVRENRADIGIFVDAMNSNGLQRPFIARRSSSWSCLRVIRSGERRRRRWRRR